MSFSKRRTVFFSLILITIVVAIILKKHPYPSDIEAMSSRKKTPHSGGRNIASISSLENDQNVSASNPDQSFATEHVHHHEDEGAPVPGDCLESMKNALNEQIVSSVPAKDEKIEDHLSQAQLDELAGEFEDSILSSDGSKTFNKKLLTEDFQRDIHYFQQLPQSHLTTLHLDDQEPE